MSKRVPINVLQNQARAGRWLRFAAIVILSIVLPSAHPFVTPTIHPCEFGNRAIVDSCPRIAAFERAKAAMDSRGSPLAMTLLPSNRPTSLAAYMLLSNLLYLARRSRLRKMSKRSLLRIRLTREKGVSLPLYLAILLTWQLFVAIFPLLEPFVGLAFRRVCFFYSYPNANGLGILLEPRHVQHLRMSQRAKHQIRLDWHRFSLNVGKVGRDGYRHPPSVNRNWPHLDVPQRGWKHWPWRRRTFTPDLPPNKNAQNRRTNSHSNG